MDEMKFEVIEELGILFETEKGWKKEFNLISWNSSEPKYDIRMWAPEHKRIGKGITFTKEEMLQLRDIINRIEL